MTVDWLKVLVVVLFVVLTTAGLALNGGEIVDVAIVGIVVPTVWKGVVVETTGGLCMIPG